MVRRQLNEFTETVTNRIAYMNEKLKICKKQLKHLNKLINDYSDKEKVKAEQDDLINIISMLEQDLYKYKKILYRLNVIRDLLEK